MTSRLNFLSAMSKLQSDVSAKLKEEAALDKRIKVVGPDYYLPNEPLLYQATDGIFGLDSKCGYGRTPADAIDDLKAQMGF